MQTQHFVAELLLGHKGAAVIVPFDPGAVWGTRPVEHGVLPWREGHLVRGKIDGVRFDGWIGRRWGRFFLLVDAALQRKAGVKVGDMLQVELAPRGGKAPMQKRSQPGAALAAGKAASKPRRRKPG
jgi:hypothetical protein